MSQDSPSAALASLPDDPELLKPLVAQLVEELRKRDGRIEQLEHRLELLLRRLYGRQSERLDPRQQTLFASPAEDLEPMAPPAPPATPSAPAFPTSRSGHGRRRIPDALRRVEVVHDLSPAEKEALGGGANLVLIGREVTEQLEWEPSCLYVIRHVQLTYARRNQLLESGLAPAEQNVVTAAKPPQMFPECGLNIPFTIENYAYPDRFGRETVTWIRTFQSRRRRRFDAYMIYSESRGCIVDYLGSHQHLAVDLELAVDERGGIGIRSGAPRFYEGSIVFSFPLFFSGIADVCEWYDDDAEKFRIQVEVSNRTWGRLFGYRGSFDVA